MPKTKSSSVMAGAAAVGAVTTTRSKLSLVALATAGAIGLGAPGAFAVTKKQTRQLALERIERDVWASEIESIWASPETLARIRDYVARTLRKG